MRNSLRNLIIRISYSTKLLLISYIVAILIALVFAFISKKACIAFIPLVLAIPFWAIRDTNIDIVKRNNLFLVCLANPKSWADLIAYTPLILVTDLKIPFPWFTLIIYIVVILLLLFFIPKRISKIFKKMLK